MALPPAGVKLVAQDASAFDSALKAAGNTLDGFGKTATAVTSSVNAAFSGIASTAGRVLAPIGALFDRIFTSVIRTVVNDAIRQLERFGAAMVKAAVEGTALESSIDRLGVSLSATAKSAFAPFVERLGEMVDNAAPAFLGIVEAAESYLGGLGESALTWGSNFVNQFAQGMWNAVGSILQVLTDIANMITYWLSPGSPPRLLPDIDKWGTAAANEFFGGWMKADFGIFNELSGTLTNLIRSIPLPKGDQAGIVPNILGARQGIAKAVEELKTAGTISVETMKSITDAVGTSDESVRAYLESMVKLQAASDTVKAAQDELNAVTKVYQDLLKPIEAEIAGISEEQQQLADEQKKSLLQLVLKDPSATLAEKRQAQLEIERLDAEKRRRALLAEQAVAVEGAQDKLDAAKEAEQLAKDDFEAKKALILIQTEQNNLLKEQLRLMEALAGGGPPKPGVGPKPAGGGKPGPSPFDIKPFDIGDFIPPDILSKWDAFLTAFGGLWTKMLEVFQPAIKVWNDEVIPAWERLVKAFTDSRDDIISAISQIIAFAARELGIALPKVFENVGLSLDALTGIWDRHHKAILAITVFVFNAISATVAGTLIILSAIVAGTLRVIEGLFDVAWALIQDDTIGAWDIIGDTVVDVMMIVGSTIDGVLNAAFAMFDLTTADIVRVWRQAFAALELVVDVVLPRIRLAIETVMENIRLAIQGPLIAIGNLVLKLIELWDWLQTHVLQIDLPGLPDLSGPATSVNGPARPGLSGGVSFNTSTTGGNMTYAPTYVSVAPPPSQGFAVMQSLFG